MIYLKLTIRGATDLHNTQHPLDPARQQPIDVPLKDEILDETNQYALIGYRVIPAWEPRGKEAKAKAAADAAAAAAKKST